MSLYRLFAPVVGGIWACTLASCSPQEEPQRYRVPREEVREPVRDPPGMGLVAPAGNGRARLAYDVPEGWMPGTVGGMRKAAFVVQDGERKVEITAIDLAARAGALLPNVNLWRKQIQLDEITAGELDTEIRPIQVAGVGGHYVELLGPKQVDSPQAILGVVVNREDRAWFFKLCGDAELALREKDRFRNFVKSVRFGEAGGAENGD